MDPLVAIIPQSLPILIDRLPFYVSFLTQHGFIIDRQTACTLSPLQAQRLLARTGDELFTSNTRVAVLLLGRAEAYTAFNALRQQLDIVYGSGDRNTAIEDINDFFALEGDTQSPSSPPPPPPPAEPPIITEETSSGPPSPISPRPRSDAFADEKTTQERQQEKDEQEGEEEAETDRESVAEPTPIVLLTAPTAPVGRDSPAPATEFHWEEIEPDQTQVALPSSPSPQPSSPSLTPVEFHPAPASPSLSASSPQSDGHSVPSSPLLSPTYHHSPSPPPDFSAAESRSPALPSDLPSPPLVPPNTATLSVSSTLKRAKTTPATPLHHSTAAGDPSSPLHAVEIKRASLSSTPAAPTLPSSSSFSSTSSTSTSLSIPLKGPKDLLSLPSRLTIKERLAALNLKDEAAPAQTASPMRVGPAGGGSGAAALREKQQRINDMFVRRQSLERTKAASAARRIASIAALGPDAPMPVKAGGTDEYRDGLPSREMLLSSGAVTVSGVLHHMTGEEEAWEQRFCLLHHDSLYLCAPGGEDAETAVMMVLSSPGISLAYAEGVVEVKGARDRHLFAAELTEIDNWYALLCRAKIQHSTEERRQHEEEAEERAEDVEEEEGEVGMRRKRGKPARRGTLQQNPQAKALAAAIMGRAPSPVPSAVQEEIRHLKAEKGVVGVSAVRHAPAIEPEEEKQGPLPSIHQTLPSPPSVHSPTSGLSSFPFPVPAPLTVGSTLTSNLDDLALLRSLLVAGAPFRKYRHRRAKQRWIWCSPQLDRLYWGEVKGRKVKGEMLAVNMISVTEGCVGVKRAECGLTVIGKDRTLDLEAETVDDKVRWIRAIALLINLNRN